jgi:cytoskeleton protein RodZ
MNSQNAIPDAKTGSEPKKILKSFKDQRESMGLSLKDIFAATRISVTNLLALEDGDFKSLPPPIYTRSFIKKYARAIGMDEQLLMQAYEDYLATTKKPAEIREVRKPWPEENRRYLILYVSLFVLVVAGLIVFAFFLCDSKDAPSVVVSSPVSEHVETSIEHKPETPSAVLQANPEPEAIPQKITQSAPDQEVKNAYQLTIKARELTWIRIVTDKTDVGEVLLKPGEEIEREASASFFLDIGNAGGVDVLFQGKPLGALGKPGEVVHVHLPTEELKAGDQ